MFSIGGEIREGGCSLSGVRHLLAGPTGSPLNLFFDVHFWRIDSKVIRKRVSSLPKAFRNLDDRELDDQKITEFRQ